MNLLTILDDSQVAKTGLSRKLTLGGQTKAYPVYRVRLDLLYYNDQNDRIATWITQYKNDENNVSFSELNKDEFNNIIENFIISSNPAAIEKTKNNIALVNQREPGVVLADGRIIDGNRRYTCLRLLNRENGNNEYFETVILDASIECDQKQIKMLELAIQHGEEQRVDYNMIDMAIGAYHDIIETGLLSIEEYCSSTNEPISEVKRRLAAAQLIIEFLEFMKVPKQYHIARDMQVYSLFYEMVPLIKRLEDREVQEELKKIVFSNTMMGSFVDHRKYIRNVKAMMDSGLYASYIKNQNKIVEEIEERKEEVDIKTKSDLSKFVKENEDLIEDLQISMDRSMLQSKKTETRRRPSQIVTKSISMLMDVDTRIIDKLSLEEKEKLRTQLHKLTDAVSLIIQEVEPEQKIIEDKTFKQNNSKGVKLANSLIDKPFVYCVAEKRVVTSLNFSLEFKCFRYLSTQNSVATTEMYFVDKENENLSDIYTVEIDENAVKKVVFSLQSKASDLNSCFLIIRNITDSKDEAQTKIEFNINISFSADFNV